MAVVRTAILAWVAAATVSCGHGRLISRAPSAGDRALIDTVSTAGRSMEALDLTREDFEGIERLTESPADAGDAGLEDLLAIPGFPEALARRVVEAKDGRRGGTAWVERLTPPERAALYRFRDYLFLPARSATRLEARVTADGPSEAPARKTDCLVALSHDGGEARWRGRVAGEKGASAFYLARGAFSDAVRIHAGSFVPDFGMGLLSGGSLSSYLFGGAYPFHGSRRIAGNTSFYGPSILGGAAELWYGRGRGVLYAGRLREYESGRFDLADRDSWGGRFELKLRRLEIGVSSVSGSAAAGGLHAVDAKWRNDAACLGLELGAGGGGQPALLWGGSCRADGARAAFLFHSIPRGSAAEFTGVNGRSLAAASSHHGATAVAECRLLSRVAVRASFETYFRGDGFEERRREEVRLEAERTWRRLSLKLVWTGSFSAREKAVPYPGSATPSGDESASVGLHASLRFADGVIAKAVFRKLGDGGSSGFLFAPALDMRLLAGRLAMDVSGAMYRVFDGRPVCYFYEPSLKGIYPWRVASPGHDRTAIGITLNCNNLHFSLKAAWEVGSPVDATLQVALRL